VWRLGGKPEPLGKLPQIGCQGFRHFGPAQD
jgi:hypothetical protein